MIEHKDGRNRAGSLSGSVRKATGSLIDPSHSTLISIVQNLAAARGRPENGDVEFSPALLGSLYVSRPAIAVTRGKTNQKPFLTERLQRREMP